MSMSLIATCFLKQLELMNNMFLFCVNTQILNIINHVDDTNSNWFLDRQINAVELPMPVKIRDGEANEEAKLSEFQQELMQLASVLNGDHLLTSLQERIAKQMNVREGIAYMRGAVKRFFEAGVSAKRMGVDEEQIVKMRPSLTSRTSPSAAAVHP